MGQGKGKGGGGTETEFEQLPNFTPEQLIAFNRFVTQFNANLGQGVPGFEGEFAPGINELEQTGFDAFQDPQGFDVFQQAVNKFNPEFTGDLFGAGVESIQQGSQGFDPNATNAFFDQSILNPAIRNFEKSLVPLAERFAGQNATSSGAFNQALTESAGDLSTNLAATRANLLFNTQQAGLDRQLRGGGQLLGAAGLASELPGQFAQPGLIGLDVAKQQLGAGGFQRAIEQDKLQAQFNEFLRTQPQANPSLNFAPTIFGSAPFDTVGIQTEKEQGKGGRIGTIAGTIIGAYWGQPAAGAGIGGAIGGLFDS